MYSLEGFMGRKIILWVLTMFGLSFALFINGIAAGSFTFKIDPQNPVVGQKAKYYLYTWITNQDGEPDFSRPLNMSGYPFDVRAYKDEEFPGSFAPDNKGIPIQLKQTDENAWSGEIMFPQEGVWFIVLRNNYPPLTLITPPHDQAILEVQVAKPRSDPASYLVIGSIMAITLLSILVFVVWYRRKVL
jgi:hypothetical protein